MQRGERVNERHKVTSCLRSVSLPRAYITISICYMVIWSVVINYVSRGNDFFVRVHEIGFDSMDVVSVLSIFLRTDLRL